MKPYSLNTPTARLRRELRSCDFRCPACAFNLRGNRTAACPECGREITLRDLPDATAPLSPAVHFVDQLGVTVSGVLNLLLAAVGAFLVLGWGWGSWFTDELLRVGRDSVTIWGIHLCVLAFSYFVWINAWERWSFASFHAQVAIAAWCYLLTIAHVVGIASIIR
ncbi:MAG: hypothetical protein ACKVU4_04175 [Phycisphaerales bacterium]